MNCEDYQDQLLAYMDGELSAEEETLLVKHLQGCPVCTEEMNRAKLFAHQVHNATVPFRQSSERIYSRVLEGERTAKSNRVRKFLAPALAGIAIVIVIVAYFSFPSRTSDIESLVSWGVEHYALLDQAHAVRGNAETVHQWFQDHHHIDVLPPRGVDYSELTGCKMTKLENVSVPLLRFNGKETKAVFIFPSQSFPLLHEAGVHELTREGFRIRLWTEGRTTYMSVTKEV